jgi:hypothetical protein
MPGIRRPHRFRPSTIVKTINSKRSLIDSMISISENTNKIGRKMTSDKDEKYMFLRILGRVYCLNYDEIPESGMLRSLYDMKGDEIQDIEEEWFTSEVIDFFFQLVKNKKIIGQNTSKIGISITNYNLLLKTANYFQIDEESVKEDVELHWIYRYSFRHDSYNNHYRANIFYNLHNKIELLSITYSCKHTIASFALKYCVIDDIRYECVVVENSDLSICKIEDKYSLYESGKFVMDLEAEAIENDDSSESSDSSKSSKSSE